MPDMTLPSRKFAIGKRNLAKCLRFITFKLRLVFFCVQVDAEGSADTSEGGGTRSDLRHSHDVHVDNAMLKAGDGLSSMSTYTKASY